MTTNEILQHAIHIAASKLHGFRIHRIIGEATMADAAARADDLLALADIFDDVFEACGENARSEFGISEKDVRKYFASVVRNAVEGDATFAITDAMQARQEADADAQAEMRREFRYGD